MSCGSVTQSLPEKFFCALVAGERPQIPDLNTVELINYCDQHGITALAYHYLHKDYQSDQIPVDLLKSFSIAFAANKKLLEQRRMFAEKVFQQLDENNIKALTFKGAANAYLLYESPQHRQHADIDLLIEEKDFDLLKHLLVVLGFNFDEIKPSRFGPYQVNAYLKEGSSIQCTFDIHWRVNNRQALANIFSFDELYSRSLTLQAYGENAKCFGYQDALLVACVHQAGSLPIERDKLISLYDIYLLSQILGEEGLIDTADQAIKKKLGRVFFNYTEKSIDLFGNSHLKQFVKQIKVELSFSRNELSAALLKPDRSYIYDQWLDLLAVDSVGAKLNFLISKLQRKLVRRSNG